MLLHLKMGCEGMMVWKQGYLSSPGKHIEHAGCNSIKCKICNLSKEQKMAIQQSMWPRRIRRKYWNRVWLYSANQYQTNVPGAPSCGKCGVAISQPYNEGIMFCYSSRSIYMEYQVSLTRLKNNGYQDRFWMMAKTRVTVTTYHMKDDIYILADFLRACTQKVRE